MTPPVTAMHPVGEVHVLVPDGIDDPRRPSGGNTYDRRVCDGLAELGWSVGEYPVAGRWPLPDRTARAGLASVLAGIPDGEVVLIDGLIASTAAEILVPMAHRLRVVILLHMPLGDLAAGMPPAGLPVKDSSAVWAEERAVLSAAAAVITTSEWTRRALLERYALPSNRIHVARPGAEPADLALGTATGGALLCVAAVTPNKGHDILLTALAMVSDLPWRCCCVGSLTRDRDFVDRLDRQAGMGGIAGRVTFTGPRTGSELNAAYAAADLLVLASNSETYGMVVTEALARGIPVIATDVGGIPEAIGQSRDGNRPALLVAAGDAAGLAGALRCWLADAELRVRLRRAARKRRATLAGWSTTSLRVAAVLSAASR